MNREELSQLISNNLVPLGFVRRRYWWRRTGIEVDTLVNLQKSQFGDQFYLNFGYVLKALPLDGLRMHVHRRMSSTDKSTNARLQELLNLGSPIPDSDRTKELVTAFVELLIPDVGMVENEADVLRIIRSVATLHVLPLITKRHFGIE